LNYLFIEEEANSLVVSERSNVLTTCTTKIPLWY
jgi:hypothetical protein